MDARGWVENLPPFLPIPAISDGVLRDRYYFLFEETSVQSTESREALRREARFFRFTLGRRSPCWASPELL
jgi:hypothetical protein